MTEIGGRHLAASLQDAVRDAISVEVGSVYVDAACVRYREEDYDVTPWLREFLKNYSELTVIWNYKNDSGIAATKLSTVVNCALSVPRRNVRNDVRRIGKPVLPVGLASETEDRVLLAEDGEILIAGDAGTQRVANGFEAAIRALIANDWDKTYLFSSNIPPNIA
ncbi:SUKH-3 domain-containing protein [Amycolatopsis sp. cmx-11-51]|uniref:SUKH-3 domain-containing protein n=1 Tax=Amycolatopsis sp. cmx-11-51 TaxID=2785797 RepID=UPI0039E3B813